MPYVKATEPHLLETYTPEVTQAYIRSRLESVAVVISDGKCDFTKFSLNLRFSLISRNFPILGLEDPLEDVGMVTQQLDQISVIGRYVDFTKYL